ncbi:MAG TPA: hypothetical protein VHO06_21485, partial [Polyangia bacterium]|nr:hypothetical protein [Polyangia bacterium]
AAIRAIEEQYARALEAPGAPAEEAEAARRAALAGVLGSDGLHAFNFAERKAERRVRGQMARTR